MVEENRLLYCCIVCGIVAVCITLKYPLEWFVVSGVRVVVSFLRSAGYRRICGVAAGIVMMPPLMN